MRKSAIAATSILGLSAFAASILVGQQQEVQALSLGSSLVSEPATVQPTPTATSPQPTETTQPAPTESASASESPSETSAPSSSTYADGDFTSTAVRYKYGTIQLGVTVSGGAIAAIDLIQASTKGRGYDQAPPMLVDAAISAQGTNFGNLSGATYSTQAFKQALSNALEQAAQN